MKRYIWQTKSWPKFHWKKGPLFEALGHTRLLQGKLLSQVNALGFPLDQEATAEILIQEAIQTSAIEGERLNPEMVRSSVARHLGLSTAGLPQPDQQTDGLVAVLINATSCYAKPLTAQRLKGWHAALFPTGYSGIHPIRSGQWRRGLNPMQVISGPLGREKVHFEAPPANKVPREMRQFFSWWKMSTENTEGFLRAGIAHFYFVTIHPFEDGNGRLARALTDMALAQDEKLPKRFYSLSSQIMAERDVYYAILEKNQASQGDITQWLLWFLECSQRAILKSETILSKVLAKAAFWKRHGNTDMNSRQRKVINRLLDAGQGGFLGGLTTRKYVSLVKVSRATAYREMIDLVEKDILKANPGGGRNVSYDLNWGCG